MREYEYKGGYSVSGSAQTTFSPRAQFAIKPDWEKDMVFRFQEVYTISHHLELRDAAGGTANVKAQQSVHFVLSNDYSFKMWDRPFKLELYYKSLTDVNTYTIENTLFSV
jgi:hypothetical protein